MAIHLKIDPDDADFGEGLPPGARLPARYAASAIPSRGRFHAEPDCSTRSPFQRDRDRVLHSTAFRRLTYKTQVFLFHEGDHYRTRLTHSLEVAQIARTIARQLRLDEDLAEALALAHDLGHSPFGHAGERALDRAMADYGGFDHNAQSLRTVARLERKYLGFDGLNLTWETLEGLAKHNGPVTTGPILKATRGCESWQSFDLVRWASGEAQVAALSDDLAYLTHDVDDGLRAGLISLSDLKDVPVAREAALQMETKAGDAGLSRRIYEVSRRMITMMIADLVTETRARLRALDPQSPDYIRNTDTATVRFSSDFWAGLKVLRAFLYERVYRSARVTRSMDGAEAIVAELFTKYLIDPAALPEAWRQAAETLSERRRARLIGDFVAGQTDRFAIAEHRRLFDHTPDLL